jgi:hypothetical protein
VRAQIVRLMPAQAHDRAGWAVDIYAAFAAQGIDPTTQNLCATLAIADQESGFHIDAAIPGLAKIAREEIDQRAAEHHIPLLLVHGALSFESPNGKTYDERLSGVRTEHDISRIYEDFIGSVPLGRRLFEGENPVRTVGPMQVSVVFAEKQAHAHPYPYVVEGSIRQELFGRRGGIYFGVAHLLGYKTSYPQMLYRFADYNAGQFASRNAAFQQAVALASGIPIQLDGDLLSRDGISNGPTELAVRVLRRSLDLSDVEIHRALLQGDTYDFEQTSLYLHTFSLAEQIERHSLPRAVIPQIVLVSPKITRKLTTAWYANRVNQRYLRCLGLSSRPAAQASSDARPSPWTGRRRQTLRVPGSQVHTSGGNSWM